MKQKNKVVLPLMLMIFALLGLELQVLPYIPFGGGRWIDSVSKNTSNRSIEVRGDINITGNYYKNGVLFSGGGGTPITGSDENTGILSEVTGLDFVGNIFTATGDTGTGLLTVTSTIDTNDFFTRFNLDTTKIGHLSENNSWTGSNSFGTGTQTIDALYVTGSIVNDGLTQTDSLSVIQGGNFGGPVTMSGTLTAGSNTNITGFTQLGNSATAIKQKLISGITATTVNGAVTYAHGLTNGQIISMTASLRVDTSGMGGAYKNDVYIYPLSSGFMGAGFQFTAWYDSLNVGTYLGSTANAIKGDSVFFLLTYRE